ncbi:MAG: molybdopterin-dependent oxidoreductase [bacterium]
MRLPALPADPPPFWPVLSTRVRNAAVTARIGRVLGIAFSICFVTGLISHLQYHPLTWLPTPAVPVWGYRITQGLHVITGLVSIPLLLAKLWSVYPKLFAWPAFRTVLQAAERASILVLVGSSLLELGTGFLNIMGWYPWPWGFIAVHYWLAFVIVGSIGLHIAVKLDTIKRGLATPLDAPFTTEGAAARPAAGVPSADDAAAGLSDADEAEPVPAGMTRRGALITAGAGAGLIAVTTAGQTLRPLEPVAVLAVRRPADGPLGIPINRTAADVGVQTSARAADYRLQVTGPRPFELDLAALEALPTTERRLPISCVEGWSAGGTWRGPMLYDLVRRAGGDEGSSVRITSLQKTPSPETSTEISGAQMRAALLATHLNGVRLPLDHGYPVRLIAPDRAGALNTKWLARIDVTL